MLTVCTTHLGFAIETYPTTICLKWLNKSVTNTDKNSVLRDHALPNVSDWSFEDYVTNSYPVKDIINEAMYVDQPDDKFM